MRSLMAAGLFILALLIAPPPGAVVAAMQGQTASQQHAAEAGDQAQPQAPQPQISLARYVGERIESTLDRLEEDGRYDRALLDLVGLLDELAAHADPRHHEQFRRAAAAMRMVHQLGQVPAQRREALLPYLRANPRLASTLALAVAPDRQAPAGVYELLDRLRQRHGARLNTYANLATAICIVHDRELRVQVNENSATAADPVALFEYYVRHESRMALGLRNVPPQLLMYVVDTTATVEELTWALGRYQDDREVGRRYFEVRYDFNHLRRGTPKRVTVEGFNLPNILEYGGVCADQAYFAVNVGKAMGIPTAYTVGRGADLGHAWVGYFQVRGRQARWNFDVGRYREFQDIRGVVRHPQYREWIPDAFVSLQAEMLGTSREARQGSIALADAAARILQWQRQGLEPPPAPQRIRRADLLSRPRSAEVGSALSLLEAAVNQNPANKRAWLIVRHLAEEGELSTAQLQRWAGTLERFCGRDYPDFAANILIPMVRSIPDVARQNAMWERVYNFFRQRPDIAAEIRFAQARMWEEADQPWRAGRAYEDILANFPNSGPFVLEALERSEQTLRRLEQPQRIPTLYGQTWQRIRRPTPTAYTNVSNWYRVGERYAEVLEEFGNRRQAQEIRSRLAEVWRGSEQQ